jgi:predicted nucleic acid-binding Zn ribbon protein
MSNSGGPKKLGDVLGQVFAARGLGQVTALRELELAWREVASEVVYKHTRLGALRRGTLEILVDHSTLLQELEGFQKQSLLAGLMERVRHSDVRALRFRKA